MVADGQLRDASALGDVESLLADRPRIGCTSLLLERLAEHERGDGVQRRDPGRRTVDPITSPNDRRGRAVRLPQSEPPRNIDVAGSATTWGVAAMAEQIAAADAPMVARLREAGAIPPAALRAPGWLAYAASILLAVAVGSGGTFLMLGDRQEDAIASQAIDSHLRSLLGTHLTDVASSDQHTVKPWFAGRLDFAPWTANLSDEGFPREHVINVFVLPASKDDLGKTLTRRGYTVRHWDEADLGFWAVTDAAPSELAEFERIFRTATGG